MPLFEGGREDFIMASHYERMVQSNCYVSSQGSFSCTACHNPHVSKKETPVSRYNRVCAGCHNTITTSCSLTLSARQKNDDNCVHCHMRKGSTRDIPHVSTHDHKISIPPTAEDLKTKRIFKGLISVNNPGTDDLTMARGYLLEYESFHPDPVYLDSAWIYLTRTPLRKNKYYFNALVNYYFLKNESRSVIDLVERKGITRVMDSVLVEQEYSNYDAWTAYRIGQAYENTGNRLVAGYFYKKAVDLAPFILEFLSKHGSILAVSGHLIEAVKVFQCIIEEDPQYTSAYVNLGYLYVKQNQVERGEKLYHKALLLDPDHVQALLNLAAIYAYRSDGVMARVYIDRVLKIEPDNVQANQLRRNN